MASFKFFGYQVQKTHRNVKKNMDQLVQMWVSASLHNIRCPHNVQLHSHWGWGGGDRLIRSSTAHALIHNIYSTSAVTCPYKTQKKMVAIIVHRLFNLKKFFLKGKKNQRSCCCSALRVSLMWSVRAGVSSQTDKGKYSSSFIPKYLSFWVIVTEVFVNSLPFLLLLWDTFWSGSGSVQVRSWPDVSSNSSFLSLAEPEVKLRRHSGISSTQWWVAMVASP